LIEFLEKVEAVIIAEELCKVTSKHFKLSGPTNLTILDPVEVIYR
jgi:hypothetical protein